jgi:hypothetical protein
MPRLQLQCGFKALKLQEQMVGCFCCWNVQLLTSHNNTTAAGIGCRISATLLAADAVHTAYGCALNIPLLI